MPVLVIKNRKVRTIAPGARVIRDEGIVAVVAAVDHKVKWSTLTYQDGSYERILSDSELPVQHSELTEEEAKEAEHRRATEWITSRIDEAPQVVEARKAQLIEQLSTKSVGWHAATWANYAASQVEAAIWERVAKVAENRQVDLVEAVRLVEADISKKIIRDLSPVHTSTSAISTFASAIELQATVEWVRELEWHIF